MGRLQSVYNQDRFMILRKSYVLPGALSSLSDPFFLYTPTTGIQTYTNITFHNYTSVPSCLDGLMYTWDFGDGTVITTASGTDAPIHAYHADGTYTVKLTISSPEFGARTATATITVQEPDPCPECE
jgi:PKD repeat protein